MPSLLMSDMYGIDPAAPTIFCIGKIIMLKNILFLIIVFLVLTPMLFAAVIEGKLVNLDPLTKSIRIKHINGQGKEEQIDIGVPDGTAYWGSAPSFAQLPAGAKLAITVEVGSKPGTWEAVDIKETAAPKKVIPAQVPPPQTKAKEMKEEDIQRAFEASQSKLEKIKAQTKLPEKKTEDGKQAQS